MAAKPKSVTVSKLIVKARQEMAIELSELLEEVLEKAGNGEPTSLVVPVAPFKNLLRRYNRIKRK